MTYLQILGGQWVCFLLRGVIFIHLHLPIEFAERGFEFRVTAGVHGFQIGNAAIPGSEWDVLALVGAPRITPNRHQPQPRPPLLLANGVNALPQGGLVLFHSRPAGSRMLSAFRLND
jgi:hypothetical protein